MVLTSRKRESIFIKEGRRLVIPVENQQENEMVHQISFPGLGDLEAIPNGDAAFYTDLLDVTDTIHETGRYSLRWPGWCAFWRPLKELGFLDDDPVEGLDCEVTPHQFLAKLIGPQIQYSQITTPQRGGLKRCEPLKAVENHGPPQRWRTLAI